MFFYQRDNSNRCAHIQVDVYDSFSFPIHLHRDLELAYPLKGEVRLRLRNREEFLGAGQLALILPHELHGYEPCGPSKMLVCVFSADHVPAFVQTVEGMRGDRSTAPCPPGLRAYLDETFFDVHAPEPMQFKAALYAACAQFQRHVHFSPAGGAEDGALERLILYVEENYRENITLSSAARAIGYNKNYLSRCFHQATGVNFRQFVNYQRVQCACKELQQGGRSISEAALASGFQNLRSFNRAFRALMGESPRACFGAPAEEPASDTEGAAADGGGSGKAVSPECP